ncbi:hypothetical protein FRC03_009739 [Tulasnella sp. 419]|nr:hypothetical protein FRC03_009739 [Tulasnella sp. 419]
MLDNGRGMMNDDKYAQYQARFKGLFYSRDLPVYYIPGNHDIGLGPPRYFSDQAKKRFREAFGPLQQVVDIGNHSFVMLDAPGLVDEDYKRHSEASSFEAWPAAKGGPVAFIQKISSEPPNYPSIVLSHIPLARPATAKCGRYRESSKGMRRGAGVGYQNLLGKDTTHFVLQSLKPILVLSGDNHDYCDYTHKTSGRPNVREVTVRTFSTGMGVKQPGFQLLSLYNPSNKRKTRTYDYRPCFLPNQSKLHAMTYVPLFFFTILYIGYVNFFSTKLDNLLPFTRQPKELSPLKILPPSSPSFTPPGSPRIGLAVRKSSLPALSPRHSPRASLALSPLNSPVLLAAVEDDLSVYETSPRRSASYPSPLGVVLSTADQDDETAPDSIPLPMSPQPFKARTTLRKLSKSELGRYGWRRKIANCLDWMSSKFQEVWFGRSHGSGTLLPAGRPYRTLSLRVVKDLFMTAWPPFIVLVVIWNRALS